MCLVSLCSFLCPIHWIQVLSREWRCSWSSADRPCPNCVWMINNFVAEGPSYINGLKVGFFADTLRHQCWQPTNTLTNGGMRLLPRVLWHLYCETISKLKPGNSRNSLKPGYVTFCMKMHYYNVSFICLGLNWDTQKSFPPCRNEFIDHLDLLIFLLGGKMTKMHSESSLT